MVQEGRNGALGCCTRQGRRTVGRMRTGRTRRRERRVADHVKARGGALRDRKTRLNLRQLGYGRRHGVYVSMSRLSTLNCVVCMCVFVCVIIGRMQRHI
jgi:hypothetical protein